MNETYLLALITAVLCGNFVWHRFLGLEYAAEDNEPAGLIFIGSLLSAVCMIPASALSFLISGTLEECGIAYLNVAVTAMILAAAEIAVSYLMERFRPENRIFKGYVHVFLNSAVIAAVMTSAECANLQESMEIGIISAVGLLFASMIFWGIRERMEISDVPESFSGAPILIIAAGLCAMIFTGFTGLTF